MRTSSRVPRNGRQQQATIRMNVVVETPVSACSWGGAAVVGLTGRWKRVLGRIVGLGDRINLGVIGCIGELMGGCCDGDGDAGEC